MTLNGIFRTHKTDHMAVIEKQQQQQLNFTAVKTQYFYLCAINCKAIPL